MKIVTQPIIFLHIPKSGGSTFHTILGKKYHPSEIYNIFGARQTDPEIIAFYNKPPETMAKINLLKGHMPFGLHEKLTSEAKYITFLREPVSAVTSKYYYIKKNAHNPKHREVHESGMSIEEFVTSGVVYGANNCHCRFLTGDIDRLAYGENASVLEDAIGNIEKHFLWVGLTERFDESVLVLANLLGWKKPPYYIRQNVNQQKKPRDSLAEQTIKIINDYNQQDKALYEYANNKLDEQISRIPDFSEQLEKFVTKNRKLASRYAWLPDKLQAYFL